VEELQTLVGGYFEVVSTIDGRFLVLDDNGKLKQKPLNKAATRLYIHGRSDVIVGDAMLVDTRLELDGPDEEEADDEMDAGSAGRRGR
jgi:hypothetical protein